MWFVYNTTFPKGQSWLLNDVNDRAVGLGRGREFRGRLETKKPEFHSTAPRTYLFDEVN